MKISKLYTEYQEQPIGMDEAHPRFSWELQAEENDCRQSAYRLEAVLEKAGRIVWDTGRVHSERQFGILYEGEALLPCSGYEIRLWVWNEEGQEEKAVSRFETGLMDTRMEAWEGAQWIAAPYDTVSARTRGVFRIDVAFRMSEGAAGAGIVFGGNDERLLDGALNEYGLAGENYIRYEINVTDRFHPTLTIYRVGYAHGDTANRPFAEIPLRDAKTGKALLTEENRNEFHTLSVLVTGNQAQSYFDGYPVDVGEDEKGLPSGRVLNPRGGNDVPTYPRLNRIGFFAAGDGEVYFRQYKVSNIRTPGAVFIDERPKGSLYGRDSVFSGLLPVADDCFVLREGQITADPSHTSIPMLRRTFSIKRGMCRARLSITARGIYQCAVNGQDITNSLLAPGLTQYDRRLHYQTYDVTNLLREGKNAIGVILSSGWWSDAQTFTVSNYNYFGDKEAVLCKLVMEYENGERHVIVSDTEHWQYYGEGPYIYAGLFMGEQYDAQKEWIAKKFSCPDFDGTDWEKPVTYQPVRIEAKDVGFGRVWPEVNAGEPKLIGAYDAPVVIVEERTAKEVIPQASGNYLYDFGQEMAGVPEITFHEEKGVRIRIRYGEMRYPDLPRYQGNAGRLMRENYRDAESEDIYICRGDRQGETYRPRFTFHGFRYLEVIGVSGPPALTEVKALQYSSVTEFDGSFTSSDLLLNRFAENVKWSQRCNFINIPTDCPQRNERMGWAGDTHVFCRTALHNANLKLFYERNLTAMSDLQEENGRYPEIAPIGGGFGGITYECATIFMAWELYLQYGDERTLTRFYPGMKKYMDYMKTSGLPGRGDADVVGPLADWLAFQDTDPQLLWNAFYYREVSLMEKIARVLGRERDAREFGKIRSEAYEYWNRTFVEPSTGRTVGADGTLCDSQSSYAIAIEYGVVQDVERAAAHLARTVRENGYRVGTGFFGTGLLNRALSRNGYVEEAYRLMLQTEFPSWLYPVTQGATTIWEHWDSFTKENGFGEYNSMNSFNHYSLGSVLSWLYEDVLGIRRLEESPAYTHFELRPCIGMLDYARGSVASPFGKIEAGWRKEGKDLYYSCTIPANTSATLILADGSGVELGSGRHEVRMEDIDDGGLQMLLKKLTLEEKIDMIHGAGLFMTKGVDRLGIPALKMSDGPMGVRREFREDAWEPVGNTEDYVTYLPCNSAIASSWNREIAHKVGTVLGAEARGRGKDVILAPGINIKRSPLCGRNFEYMSEDPYLTAQQCVPMIQGIQENDVAACVKHFALNNQETNRLWVNVEVSERALREIYLPAFRAALKTGKAFTLMGAYNLVRGSRCCENEYLLDEILRREWNWDGVTISDWGGILRTKESAQVSMDIEMSIYTDFNAYFFAEPLLKAVREGEISEERIDEKVSRILSLMQKLHMTDGARKAGCYNHPSHRNIALEAARESVVLLKNEEERLPLKIEKRDRILVIGCNADFLHSNGGGSAEVKALYEISPLMGLQSQLGGDVEVRFVKGYYVPDQPVQDGRWQEDSLKDREGKTAEEEIITEETAARRKELRKEAVALAKQFQHVIYVGGLNHQHDLEDQDRRSMKLPYGQDELIEAVLKANPETVIVMNAGSPVEMYRWEKSAKAIVWQWYAGMEGGNALAEVLLGKTNPSGRLPESFPITHTDCSAHCVGEFGKKDEVAYREGIYVGYRYYEKNAVPVQYPFGHGLSYTSFTYGKSDVKVNRTEGGDFSIEIRVSICNTGDRQGKEVVQLYVKSPGRLADRPLKELKGYEKPELLPREETCVVFRLTGEDLAYFDEKNRKMMIEPGEYEVMLGASSADIRSRAKFTL